MKTKICNKCKEEKVLSKFNKRYGKPQPYCRECNRIYHKGHYQKHRLKYIADANKRQWQSRANALQYVMEYAKGGCSLCDERDFKCLEFDHLDPTTKKLAISKMVSGGYSTKTIFKELQKCRILCANCHKKHTANQFGWYTNLLPYFK